MTDKLELAEERTDWAEDRTILANERTFAGWMRTGMGSVAVAVALQAVFGEAQPTWAAKAAASVFVGVAVITFLMARSRAISTHKRLHRHDAEPPFIAAFTLLSLSLTLGALVTGAILWLL